MSIRSTLRRKKDLFLIKREIKKMFSYDAEVFIGNCNLNGKCDNHDRRLSGIIATYHVLEKGLSMPERRLGFGKEQVLSLCKQVIDYFNLYGDDNMQFHHAVEVLKEYETIHLVAQFKLDKNIDEALLQVSKIVDSAPSQQLEVTATEYFNDVNKEFKSFSYSRHSCRWFSGPVEKDIVIKSIEIAQNSPSSCNKQPTRIYFINNKEKVQEILEMQQGNRGFGHTISQVIVLMSDLNYYSRGLERKSPYVDAGIYAMNLLYSLHYNKIGAIPLVWLSNKERDLKLRNIINAPQNHIPCLIIGIGKVTNIMKQVLSPRRELSDVLRIEE